METSPRDVPQQIPVHYSGGPGFITEPILCDQDLQYGGFLSTEWRDSERLQITSPALSRNVSAQSGDEQCQRNPTAEMRQRTATLSGRSTIFHMARTAPESENGTRTFPQNPMFAQMLVARPWSRQVGVSVSFLTRFRCWWTKGTRSC